MQELCTKINVRDSDQQLTELRCSENSFWKMFYPSNSCLDYMITSQQYKNRNSRYSSKQFGSQLGSIYTVLLYLRHSKLIITYNLAICYLKAWSGLPRHTSVKESKLSIFSCIGAFSDPQLSEVACSGIWIENAY